MKKQVLVDMDGVLADVYTQFKNYELADLGTEQSAESIIGITEQEAFVNADKYVRSKGFFRTAPLMADSVEGLRYLNEKYKVLIVSSATEFPSSLIEKVDWLSEHFPFITWKQIILCGAKDSIKGDIMLDDHPKNLSTFEGDTYIFTQPHNALENNSKYVRVNNWKEVMKSL